MLFFKPAAVCSLLVASVYASEFNVRGGRGGISRGGGRGGRFVDGRIKGMEVDGHVKGMKSDTQGRGKGLATEPTKRRGDGSSEVVLVSSTEVAGFDGPTESSAQRTYVEQQARKPQSLPRFSEDASRDDFDEEEDVPLRSIKKPATSKASLKVSKEKIQRARAEIQVINGTLSQARNKLEEATAAFEEANQAAQEAAEELNFAEAKIVQLQNKRRRADPRKIEEAEQAVQAATALFKRTSMDLQIYGAMRNFYNNAVRTLSDGAASHKQKFELAKNFDHFALETEENIVKIASSESAKDLRRHDEEEEEEEEADRRVADQSLEQLYNAREYLLQAIGRLQVSAQAVASEMTSKGYTVPDASQMTFSEIDLPTAMAQLKELLSDNVEEEPVDEEEEGDQEEDEEEEDKKTPVRVMAAESPKAKKPAEKPADAAVLPKMSQTGSDGTDTHVVVDQVRSSPKTADTKTVVEKPLTDATTQKADDTTTDAEAVIKKKDPPPLAHVEEDDEVAADATIKAAKPKVAAVDAHEEESKKKEDDEDA